MMKETKQAISELEGDLGPSLAWLEARAREAALRRERQATTPQPLHARVVFGCARALHYTAQRLDRAAHRLDILATKDDDSLSRHSVKGHGGVGLNQDCRPGEDDGD
jgi:hypothetical protein